MHMDHGVDRHSNAAQNPDSSTQDGLRATSTTTKRKRKQSACDDAVASLPARRVSKACDLCRLSKVRCGGEQPHCTRCVETELPCSYDSPLRRRGPERGINYKINQRMSNLERLLAKTLDEVRRKSAGASHRQTDSTDQMGTVCVDEMTEPEPLSPSTSIRGSYQSEALEQRSAAARPPLSSVYEEPAKQCSAESPELNSSCPGEEDQQFNSITTTAPSEDSVVSTHIPVPALGTYYGSPHKDKSLAPRDMAAHLPDHSPATVEAVTARAIPDLDIVLHLIEKFFTYVHGQQYMFLHRETLVNDALSNKAASELILALCAVAARFSDHPSVQAEVPYQAGAGFAADALDIVVCNLNRPTLPTLQALLLLSLYHAGRMDGAQAWILGGMAFRAAHLLRLEREDPNRESGNWHEAEIRRRTFWYAFMLDRFSSAGSGLPWSISSDRPMPRLPVSERLFLHGKYTVAPRFADDATYHDDTLGCVAYLARLAELWGLVALYVSEPERETKPNEPSSRYRWLKSQLNKWHSRLPGRLHYSLQTLGSAVNHGEAGILAFMHMLYHASCSFVEQAVLAHFSDLPVAFLDEVAMAMDEHAHECVDIYTRTTMTYSNYLNTPLTAYMLLLSGIILARQSFVADSDTAASAYKRYITAGNGIKRLVPYWATAYRHLSTLNTYYDSLKSLTKKRQEKNNYQTSAQPREGGADYVHAVTHWTGGSEGAPPAAMAVTTALSAEVSICQAGAANGLTDGLESNMGALPLDNVGLGRILPMDMWTFPNDSIFPSACQYMWMPEAMDVSWNSNGSFPSFEDP